MSPLRGKRVLVARAEGQADDAAQLVTTRGAEAVVIPSLAIGPPSDEASVARALSAASLATVGWVVLTSANGVEWAFRAMAAPGAAADAWAGVRFAVVGTATREALAARGVVAHLVAKEFRGEGLATALVDAIQADGASARAARPRVLLLRAEEAREVLPDTLRGLGIEVDVVPVYRTRPHAEGTAEIARRVREGSLDAVVLSSGGMVAAICDALGQGAAVALASVTLVCIGPVTAAAAASRGLRVDVVPAVATFPAALEALEAFETRSRPI